MSTTPVATETAGRIAGAATAFLEALRPEERERATFDFGSDERQNWHYVPRPRKGLPRTEMDRAQMEAADRLMASSLSSMGLRKALEIMQLEVLLGLIEGGDGHERFDRNPGLYHFSVFGTPGRTEPWGWQVDGHHLSLNITVVDGLVTTPTPSFFGANPAEVRHGPQQGLRILRDEEDLARDLFLSLDAGQRDRAVIYPVAPPDIITRASRRVEVSERVGLPAEAMSAEQKQALVGLVKVYVDRKQGDVARGALKKVEEEGIGGIYFGWAGSGDRNQGHYYRIHGPSFFVEYDNTQNMANHIHAVWRDVNGDFGSDVLREHYQRHHR